MCRYGAKCVHISSTNLSVFNSTRKMSYWYGARSKREMFPSIEDFDDSAAANDALVWALCSVWSSTRGRTTDGYTGFIHNVPCVCVYVKTTWRIMKLLKTVSTTCVVHQWWNAAVIGMKDLGVEDENILPDDFWWLIHLSDWYYAWLLRVSHLFLKLILTTYWLI